MKRIKIEFYRIYFRYLIYSTDKLIARKQTMEERKNAKDTGHRVCAIHGSV